MRLLTRNEAKALGLKRYFNGVPCKHGHLSMRDTINATCVECTLGWKRRNKDHVRQYSKEYYALNRKERLAYAKKYSASEFGKKANSIRYRQWYERNKQQKNAADKIWRLTFPEKQKAADAKWRANNRDYLRKYNAAIWHVRKYDQEKKLKHYLRARTSRAIKRGQKSGSFVRDLGCTIGELKIFIEKQFTHGMSWENWGRVWHLDHVIPLHRFRLTDRQQFLKASHFTNLQPLLIAEHLKKTATEATERRTI